MKNEKIKVVIADDHDVYRDGLRMLLTTDAEIEFVGEATNGAQLIQLVKAVQPDVILTDLIMPGTDGVAAIRELAKDNYNRIIALSTFDSDHLIVEALEAGATGYLIKNAQKGDIIHAIKTVFDFQPFYCSSSTTRLVRLIANSQYNPYTKANLDLFSDTEKEIIKMICDEKSSEEISQALFMSKRTIDGMRGKILIKMNVRTMAGVAIYAIKNAIYHVKPDSLYGTRSNKQ